MSKLKYLVLLLICGIVYFMLAVGSSSDSTSVSSNSDGSGETTIYHLNEDIYITKSTGKYRVKFTNIKETKERNRYSDKEAKRVIVIDYEYENIDQESDLYVSDVTNFKLYDKDNNVLETYPVDIKYATSIGKGRKGSASVAYALNNDSNYIELEYYDNTWNSSPDCKVIFEW